MRTLLCLFLLCTLTLRGLSPLCSPLILPELLPWLLLLRPVTKTLIFIRLRGLQAEECLLPWLFQEMTTFIFFIFVLVLQLPLSLPLALLTGSLFFIFFSPLSCEPVLRRPWWSILALFSGEMLWACSSVPGDCAPAAIPKVPRVSGCPLLTPTETWGG